MRQYFLTIPRDLEEAAKLDGAGFLRLLAGDAAARRPGARGGRDPPVPGHLERLLLAADPPRHGNRTIHAPLGLALFRSQYQTLWPQLMAGGVMAIIRSWCSTSSSSATSSPASPAASRDERAVRRALGGALRDFYENPWRLVVPNCSARAVLARARSPSFCPARRGRAPRPAGPVAAALMHCAVTLVRRPAGRARATLLPGSACTGGAGSPRALRRVGLAGLAGRRALRRLVVFPLAARVRLAVPARSSASISSCSGRSRSRGADSRPSCSRTSSGASPAGPRRPRARARSCCRERRRRRAAVLPCSPSPSRTRFSPPRTSSCRRNPRGRPPWPRSA